MRRILLFAVAVLLSLTTACAGRVPDLSDGTTGAPLGSTAAVDTSITTTTRPGPTEPPVVPPQLEGLELLPISISDGDITYVLTVAVADTGEARNQGLMNVADLGDLDGMLFVWEEPTPGSFWMKDTILPLDIAFFTADGAWVDNFPMLPCPAEPCESYFPEGSYTYAVEVPATGFAALTPAARLILEP